MACRGDAPEVASSIAAHGIDQIARRRSWLENRDQTLLTNIGDGVGGAGERQLLWREDQAEPVEQIRGANEFHTG